MLYTLGAWLYWYISGLWLAQCNVWGINVWHRTINVQSLPLYRVFLLIKEDPHLLKHFELVSLLSPRFLVIKHVPKEWKSPENVICELPLQLFKISLRAKAIRPFINLILFCSCSLWLGNVITRSKGQRWMKRKLYKTLTKFPDPQLTGISSCWHTTHSKWPFSCVQNISLLRVSVPRREKLVWAKFAHTQTTGWEPASAWEAEN